MLKNHEKELMISINLFLDNILKINNLFKTLLQKYFDQIRGPIILKVQINDILYENISIKDNLDYEIDISKICKNNNLFKIDLIANNPKSLFDLMFGLNTKKRSIILNEILIVK